MRKPAFALALIVPMLTLVIPGSAFAGAAEEFNNAYDRGDYQLAYKLIVPLALNGDAEAQVLLGFMYENGDGVRQNDAEAARWYWKAANQGHAMGQHNLGVMYQKGYGVEKDSIEAVKWWRKAAEQGIPHAQFNLGLMYINGQEVRQDYILAHMWLNLAASRFGTSERKLRDRAAAARDSIATRMTPVQMAESQRLAREWKPKRGSEAPDVAKTAR